jgi:3-isopropylmalate dehydratase small subunit
VRFRCFPVLSCPGAAGSFQEGEEAELDISEARVRNITQNKEIPAQPFPKDILEILSQGGILVLLKALGEKEKIKNP